MRSLQLTFFAALVIASTLTTAQLVDSVAQPFERSLQDANILTERSLLEARQASNATSTTSAAEPSGSAAVGGEATITEEACSMTNHLSQNQQASWGNGFINTCCSFNNGVQCWYRKQDTVSAQQECEIPGCADLLNEDRSKWVGFVPLNSTNGEGKYGNFFLSLGMLSAGGAMVPMMGVVATVALAVSAMITL
ncbi:uncharacterized protein UMAG_01970 [Mycosarcoma maydis]|uniref:Uncharacterized protein n=1 Tax=Mycosarcoma maydis TaxID=5270 RepID=A0A0D1CCB6_MYCMD|nr:uncharacterized protein UMAG_01970 [Ustilago maydis 521]KIS70822.1 hypothetical protein UMAG_01970 [Ustilago maydis 521]|eukprot:XP_011387887.1 hypothetical protein UMAG_01970 [Ustilago maydis 521]